MSSVLFVPGNPAHAKAHLLVAAELANRGHAIRFLTRDKRISNKFHVESVLSNCPFEVHEYTGRYESDVNKTFPSIIAYKNSRKDLFDFLDEIDFDISVSCNDTGALFDRLVVEYSRRNKLECLLIQESIRPAKKSRTFTRGSSRTGRNRVLGKTYRGFWKAMGLRSFDRQTYGHSDCTMIAVAGDRFRKQLISEGVKTNKICVTGQPRLDLLGIPTKHSVGTKPDSTNNTILFCSQPLECGRRAVDKFFAELVSACDSLGNTNLAVKLHPRDMPPEHWRKILPQGAGQSISWISDKKPLETCFTEVGAMLTIASTTAIEAMASGLPVGLVNYLPTSWYLPYDEMGAALSIESREQLGSGIDQLLHDDRLRDKLKESSTKVIFEELFHCDGKSASRIADYIERQLN